MSSESSEAQREKSNNNAFILLSILELVSCTLAQTSLQTLKAQKGMYTPAAK